MKGGKLVNDCRPKNEEVTNEAKKCWKGYEKKGTQKLFGKTYNRCVKKEETQNEAAAGQGKQEKTNQVDSTKKDESLTREKILEATLRHHQRRLEIPVGHPSVLE